MKIGIQLAQAGRQAEPAAVRASARAAEALGYDSVWVMDRLLAPVAPRVPYPASADGALPSEQATVLDPLTTLAYVAACTDRVRLGTSVLVSPWYRPVALARSLTSIDVLSDGRLTVGLGLGWSTDEFDALGVPQRHLAERQEELFDVFDAVWSPGPAEHHGPTVDLHPATIGLEPVQRPRPPILLAAYTVGGMDRLARRADGWTPAGLPVEALAPMWATVRDLAAGHGRDPDALQLVVRANISLHDRAVDGERAAYHGSIEQVAEDLAGTEAAGAHEVVLAISGDHALDTTLAAQAALVEALASMRVSA
jgi:probable F420-dependent oxidoreductase